MTDDSLESALGETKRAAKDLARATATLARHVLKKAEVAAKDPKTAAQRAARTTAKELEAAAREVDKLVKRL